VGGLKGRAKRLHSFWPRGREFNSRRAHFEETPNLEPFLYFCTRCLFSARFDAQRRQSFGTQIQQKNPASMKMASCHRKSKNGIKVKLFNKARTYSRFLNQRHIESARSFHVLRGVEYLPTHSLLEPGSMASLNLQIFRKDFSQFYTYFTITFENLARLKIDQFQNVICNGFPCQVLSKEK
jgi:hypothetical protein